VENLKTKRILIVEDSPDLQFLLAQLFEGEGYPIVQAYDGQQALDILSNMPELPAIILLDIMMPGMGGIEFREIQRAHPQLSSIPVIVMSADANAQNQVSQLGVADFIRKPILDVDKLLEVVEHFIE
jgi:CheY-like chemotaxis protein